MKLRDIRKAIVKALTPEALKSHRFTGRESYPRRKANVPVQIQSPASEIKATRPGAVHWVGKAGTGGAVRKMRRAAL